jgi:DNA-binding beta-propeller fold protein YncE
MTTHNATRAKLTTIAYFPQHFFLENLAVRADGSILITVVKHKQLWYLPAPDADLPVDPVLVHTFDSAAMGIVEAEPDVFYVCTFGPATVERVDLRGWSPGAAATVTRVLTFDPSAVLNGACLIGTRTMLVADSVAGRIWRVDLAGDGLTAAARVWLAHHSMAFDLDNPLNPQPGVNGVRYDSKTDFLYYTSTTRKLFMRVPVDPATHQPVGEPEFVASGTMADDFCIDENAGVAYVTTHRQNTIDRVPLQPGQHGAQRDIVAGEPFTAQLVGPSSAAWGRGHNDYGRVAYVTTDGGTTAPPPDGIVRPAQLLRIEFTVD